MKIYNQAKTQVLETYDLNKGYLKKDILLTHIPEVTEIKEVGHYKTIAIYENGGKDVEWVVDIPGRTYVPAHDVKEEILVYIPYTSDELRKKENEKLIQTAKQYLSQTDYICCKLTEALSKYVITNDSSELKSLLDKYEFVLNNRKTYRSQISLLEATL